MFSDNDDGDNPSGSSPPVRSSIRLAMLLGTAVLMIGIVWWLRQPSSPEFKLLDVGQKLEKIDLQPMLGTTEPVQSSDLAGRVVVINFWGPWCGPCLIELPHLMEMRKRLQTHEDFRFVSVSCGADAQFENVEELKADSQRVLDEREFRLPVYSDVGATTRISVIKLTGSPSFSYPTSILLDREGNVRGLWPGYSEGLEKEIEQAVLTLLDG